MAFSKVFVLEVFFSASTQHSPQFLPQFPGELSVGKIVNLHARESHGTKSLSRAQANKHERKENINDIHVTYMAG